MNDTGRNTAVRKLARVVVVDDHPFFRDGLSRGLRQSGYLDVVGEAGSGREGLELIRELQPNVAVLDYPGARDRYKAAQALSRKLASEGKPVDHYAASIIDTRARAVDALVREQAEEKPL